VTSDTGDATSGWTRQPNSLFETHGKERVLLAVHATKFESSIHANWTEALDRLHQALLLILLEQKLICRIGTSRVCF
jgi:hypothetical protein